MPELVEYRCSTHSASARGRGPNRSSLRCSRRSTAPGLIDAGADAGRRIELSARGERFTTILHEIVLLGRTNALQRVLAGGVSPSRRCSILVPNRQLR
jgi:hypothetical protein